VEHLWTLQATSLSHEGSMTVTLCTAVTHVRFLEVSSCLAIVMPCTTSSWITSQATSLTHKDSITFHNLVYCCCVHAILVINT
jgi:hypothetical protein